jgi:hypothetical protein
LVSVDLVEAGIYIAVRILLRFQSVPLGIGCVFSGFQANRYV